MDDRMTHIGASVPASYPRPPYVKPDIMPEGWAACATCDGTGIHRRTAERVVNVARPDVQRDKCPGCAGLGLVEVACKGCNGTRMMRDDNRHRERGFSPLVGCTECNRGGQGDRRDRKGNWREGK